MKVMMIEAVRIGYANADPAAGVESFTEKHKVRGIITPDEILASFYHIKGIRRGLIGV